ncbi:hypothetical protein [Novacetimonas pomaceti]|uniref:hypothetical protein n=1 Tax=Novacetimonas pomaceti TaxID=2021998 RepID=UPI001EF03F4C|nr:hypothetical protein [Novacetimonas pomaceti]
MPKLQLTIFSVQCAGYVAQIAHALAHPIASSMGQGSGPDHRLGKACMRDQHAQRLTGRRRKTISAFFADGKCIIWGFDTSIDTIQHAGTQVSNAKDFPRVFPSTRSETV